MNAFRWVAAAAMTVTLAGCSGSGDEASSAPVMPDVLGLQLDDALSQVESAGSEDEVEVEGGGVLGVVEESNWQVCAQSPAGGEDLTSAPRLDVERSCDDSGREADTTEPEAEAAPEEPTEEILTAETNADLAAILGGGDCDDTLVQFASQYDGSVIEFDGSIGAMQNHGDYDTRYDFLVNVGDFSETSQIGPSFQFRDVGIPDLHLIGEVPDSIGPGDNVHVVAQVEEFNPTTCLFRLDPVSTEIR